MRIPRSFRLIAAAALGAAAVVLPAAAASESAPTIETEDPAHLWKPPAATIEPGGTVLFKNASTTVPHGVHWVSTPATPSCDAGVPVGTEISQGRTNWSGTCQFTAPGTYTFWCNVHGSAMSGTITVAKAGEGPPPTETAPPTTTTGTPPPGGSPGGGATPVPRAGSAAAASATALAGLRIKVPRHGATLHGALTVPAVDAGGRLQVELQAARSALVAAGSVRLAELRRRNIAAGTLRFSLTPSARALRTLRRRGHLALTMKVRLSPAAGAGAAVSRRVTLHR